MSDQDLQATRWPSDSERRYNDASERRDNDAIADAL
jgi:hypothetical protein